MLCVLFTDNDITEYGLTNLGSFAVGASTLSDVAL